MGHAGKKKLAWSTPFLLLFTFVALSAYLYLAQAAPEPDTADSLKLPVPRTFEMSHVYPPHFAVALGKDLGRIFRFARDQIAYEVYTGCLRGPRGTLMAMAGNSADQAGLLASLLKESGHRVRYAHGKLPKAEAKKLVDSMWVERPRPGAADVAGELSPSLKAALDTLVAGVKRDYTLIRDHLKNANLNTPREAAPSLDSLVQEAQDHYWVQWWKDDAWLDLDPSFGDASPGRKYAAVQETFDALPDALFHRVEIRIRLEEYTGDQASSRIILSYTTKASDLSGIDLVLSHQPENWKGPAYSLESAISSAIENTGQVKPVLVVGEQPIMGNPFRQKQPRTTGMPGVFVMLSGEGTRKPVPIGTAEFLEFGFIAPGGHQETVAREIFDLVGKARRAAGQSLTADEVRARTETANAFDVTQPVYDLFFTTGRIDTVHLAGIVEDNGRQEGEFVDVRAGLRRINITFTATSDALIARLKHGNGDITLFYPNSPRLVIAQLSNGGGALQLSLDLRRHHARAVQMDPQQGDLFAARIFRGVVDETLERLLIEFAIPDLRDEEKQSPVMSTSSVFERAQIEGVRILFLSPESARLRPEVPDDARARVQEEMDRGYLVVAPERAVTLGERSRFAWWRIDARSGETIGVTDQGLHQTEYVLVHNQAKRETYIFYRTANANVPGYKYVGSFKWGTTRMAEYMNSIMSRSRIVSNLYI